MLRCAYACVRVNVAGVTKHTGGEYTGAYHMRIPWACGSGTTLLCTCRNKRHTPLLQTVEKIADILEIPTMFDSLPVVVGPSIPLPLSGHGAASTAPASVLKCVASATPFVERTVVMPTVAHRHGNHRNP